MPFVLGARGNRWAWRNGRWDSVEHFTRVQRTWAKWGAVVWIGFVVLIPLIMGLALSLLIHSEAYRLGVSQLQNSKAAAGALGAPITAGLPMGSVATDGHAGRASLSFSTAGPKGAGRVFMEAVKKNDVWSITEFGLKLDDQDAVIDLLSDRSPSAP